MLIQRRAGFLQTDRFPHNSLDDAYVFSLLVSYSPLAQPLIALAKLIKANSRAYHTSYTRIAEQVAYTKSGGKNAFIRNNHTESTTCPLSVLDAVEAHG